MAKAPLNVCCVHMKRNIKQGSVTLLGSLYFWGIQSGPLKGGATSISYCPWCGKKLK